MDINTLNNEVGGKLVGIIGACNVVKLGYIIHANTPTAAQAGVSVMSIIDDLETNDQYMLEDGDKLLADLDTLLSEYIDRWRPFTGKYVFTVEYGNFNWSELTA